MTQRTCTIDGCDKPHRARGYCGGHYNAILAPNRHRKTKACVECGSEYVTTRTDGRYCSLACRDKARWANYTPAPKPAKVVRVPVERTCIQCETRFLTDVGTRVYCSRQCVNARAESIRRLARGGRTAGEWLASPRLCTHCGGTFTSPIALKTYCTSTCSRQAAALRGTSANGSEWITPSRRAAIYDRDGYDCWLCREPVDMEADPKRSDWGPSLDHVLPRSAGGDDSNSNLRLAHRWCNAVRGDSDPHHLFPHARKGHGVGASAS